MVIWTQAQLVPQRKITFIISDFASVMDVHTGGMCVHVFMTCIHEAPISRTHHQPQLLLRAIELSRAYHNLRGTTSIMSCTASAPLWNICSPVAPRVPQPNRIAVMQSLFPQCVQTVNIMLLFMHDWNNVTQHDAQKFSNVANKILSIRKWMCMNCAQPSAQRTFHS